MKFAEHQPLPHKRRLQLPLQGINDRRGLFGRDVREDDYHGVEDIAFAVVALAGEEMLATGDDDLLDLADCGSASVSERHHRELERAAHQRFGNKGTYVAAPSQFRVGPS